MLEIQNKEETSIAIDVCFLFILFIAVIKMVEREEKSAELQASLTCFRKKRYFTKSDDLSVFPALVYLKAGKIYRVEIVIFFTGEESKMKRALIVATTASMIDQFNQNNIELLQEMGYEVHIVCNFKEGNTTSAERVDCFRQEMEAIGVVIFDLPIRRSPFAYGRNARCCYLLKKIINRYRYKIIHCHTPVGGVIARIAAIGVKKWGGKVIYTAHGFHFYKGAPLKNWLLYYPVERWLARYTDELITINQEDYQTAKNFKLRENQSVVYIPGIGIDVDGIRNLKINKEEKRRSLGIDPNKIVLISVGELNENKNHSVVLRSIAALHDPNILYIICGQGKLENELKQLAQSLNIEDQLMLLGFREDVIELFKMSDIFCFPSKREGLSVALMEAMAAGLPVICSKIRGNIDLVKDGMNGYYFDVENIAQLGYKMLALKDKREMRWKMMNSNLQYIKSYSNFKIKKEMEKMYLMFDK